VRAEYVALGYWLWLCVEMMLIHLSSRSERVLDQVRLFGKSHPKR
jgi:hypothetical protein